MHPVFSFVCLLNESTRVGLWNPQLPLEFLAVYTCKLHTFEQESFLDPQV